jgi:acetoin utilization deacetylase AcuC-like enzyme
MNNLGIIFFPAYDWAISPDHPEREERLLYTQDQLREEGLFDLPGIAEYRPELAGEEDVARVHVRPPGVERIYALPHQVSAGGAIAAGRLVLNKDCKKAFALVRPPGHHALRVVHGGRGFCDINNEAIMVERLRAEYGLKRVAIVDTDCHHGDGTQDIYWHDPDTLFISLHQDGRTLYPGSGAVSEFGGPKAQGGTINIPLPPETGDEGFLLAAREIIRPILDEWRPDLVVNSAGQDNHFTDPITNMKITTLGYAELSEIIDPDIAVLEGGYSIRGALPYLNLAIALSMAGLDWRQVREPRPQPSKLATSPEALEHIKMVGQEIHRLRRRPPPPERAGSRREGRWWVRERSIFYDSHPLEGGGRGLAVINERQREELYDCPHCPGLLVINTRSERSPLSIHAVLPRQACHHCHQKALRWDRAVNSDAASLS